MTASRIVQLRKSAGLTQEELADKAGVTVRTIQRIENNETMPRAYTMRRIAEALGVTVQDLHEVGAVKAPASEPDVANLQWLNLSCFFYLIIPFVHVLVPYNMWKKNKTETGRKIISTQIIWTISLHGSLLLALGWNQLMHRQFQNKSFLISYLWLALLMFLVNAIIIIRMNYRIMSGKCRV